MNITKGTVYKLHKKFDLNGIVFLLHHNTTDTIDPNFSEELIQARPIFYYKNDWIRPHKGQSLVYITFEDERFGEEINLWLGTDDIFVFEDLDYSEITRVISDPIGNRIVFGKDKISIDQIGTEFIGGSKTGAGYDISATPSVENAEALNPHINKFLLESGKITVSQFKKDNEADPENKIVMEVDTDIATNAESSIKIEQKSGNKIEINTKLDEDSINVETKAGQYIKLNDKKDEESIEILSKSEQSIKIDDKSGDEKIQITDKNGNIVLLNNTGLGLQDKNSNVIQMDSSGIRITDKNGNQVLLNTAGINIKTGDAITWQPCIIPNCIFSGAPHGGSIGGIVKLKGS